MTVDTSTVLVVQLVSNALATTKYPTYSTNHCLLPLLFLLQTLLTQPKPPDRPN